MNRRRWMALSGAVMAARPGLAGAPPPAPPKPASIPPEKLLLMDYEPRSVFKIPVTEIKKAKFPILDVHYHADVNSPEDVSARLKIMDAVGLEKAVVFATVGERFDKSYALYSRYPKRFDVWCGLDMAGVAEPGFTIAGVVKELERCRKLGAVGVGEVSDKGMGIGGLIGGPPNWPGRRPKAGPGSYRTDPGQRKGIHPDDPRMDPVWQKCAEFGMPVNLHVSDPYWSYLPQDQYNDGLMMGYSWRLDNKPGIMGHNELIETLERTVKRHPKTVFIACHLANLNYDLTRLGQLFDRNPNLYADISARFGEAAPIPRAANQFLTKYAHRVCYGSDMTFSQRMFSLTFRIMESQDEHFYDRDAYFNFDYHWPMHGIGLADDVLRKIYRETALAAFKQARGGAKG